MRRAPGPVPAGPGVHCHCTVTAGPGPGASRPGRTPTVTVQSADSASRTRRSFWADDFRVELWTGMSCSGGPDSRLRGSTPGGDRVPQGPGARTARPRIGR
eukprot:767410-Hanusia_phi.AAC.3